jgi:hypothetical protein
MNAPDLFSQETDTKRQQMDMAKNVARLKTKAAKQQQVHLLCRSLVRTIGSK